MENETKRDFLQHRIVSEFKGVEFVSDKLLYIVLRGRWFNIIVLDVHAHVRKKAMICKESF